jgi:hypothetical protein
VVDSATRDEPGPCDAQTNAWRGPAWHQGRRQSTDCGVAGDAKCGMLYRWHNTAGIESSLMKSHPGMPHFIEQTMNQRKLMHLNSSLNQINPSIIDTQSVR